MKGRSSLIAKANKNMNTKKVLLSGATLAAIGIIGLATASSALAYRGDYTQSGPNCTAERHEAMENAFESNDYNAWKDLMQDRGRVTQVIDENNFAQFAEAHQLAEQGKYAEADTIRQDLGFRTRNGQPIGAGFKQHMGRDQSNEQPGAGFKQHMGHGQMAQ